MIGKLVIVRTENAGAHFGLLTHQVENRAYLKNARRLWKWQGANCLSDMAQNGVARPSDCKFSAQLDEIQLLGVIEIIPCTVEACASIESVKEWVFGGNK